MGQKCIIGYKYKGGVGREEPEQLISRREAGLSKINPIAFLAV